MTARSRAVARTTTAIAGIVAAALVIGLPVTYFAISYKYMVGALETQAELNAAHASRLVIANPTMWFYEQVRLAELLERRSSRGIPEARRILDLAGHVVAESADPLPRPIVIRRHPIYDAGGPVAVIEVARSIRPLLLESAVASAGALFAAALVFAALRMIPLRAVRHAYQSLEESERRYRSLYQSMREGMALHRIAYDEGGRAVSFSVVDANPAAARMLEVEAANLVGQDGSSLLGGALRPFLPEMLRTVESGEPFTFELALPHCARTLHVSAFSPAPGHLATLLDDVTERRRAETSQRHLQEQLNQAQKMEAVGRLAGGVAHDFNNILTVILSFSSALAESLKGEQLEYAQAIEQAGRRGTALTRQILSFSRKQVLHPEVLRVDEIVASMVKMIGRVIGEDIELSLRMGDGVGCIYMDPAQLEQVLVNLSVNARDAMPEGGRLTIQVHDADVAQNGQGSAGVAPGSYVAFRVSDTGTGMDEATRSRLFEPFFTTKPKGKGTGLGLAMVLGAVEECGGYIDVATQLGAGTTFTIHLPRVAAPLASQGDASRPLAQSAGGERILVVEDEPQLRAALRLFLGAGGYSVVEAASGDEGLAAFQAEEDGIDLVLTDLVMPGMGGVSLGRAIQARRPVPVLYMSGYSEAVVSGKEKLPPGCFVQKPFERGPLLERVRAALAASTSSPSAPEPEEPEKVGGR